MIVRQHCCSKNTHFPHKMKSCESIPHTIASYLASDSPIDHIISIEKNKDTLDISHIKVLPYLITDHKPIFCIINDIPILSWNIEGLCNSKLTTERTDKIKDILLQLHETYPNIIFLFQEVYLKTQIKNKLSSIDRLKDLFNHPDYIYTSDGYTSGVIIPKKLFKKLELIQRKESKKNAMVISIKSKKPFVLVNIHLKAVRSFNPSTINYLHIDELNNIFSHINHYFKKGVVFIGDHNNKDVLPIYTQLVTS
jgi:hypothetical protein